MAQMHFPHFPHFPHFAHVSRRIVFYGLAIIPASLIVYTLFRLIENLLTGKISF